MAPDEVQLAALRQWLEASNGYLNPAVRLQYNDEAGVHCRLDSSIEADTRICTIPHSLALSSLNALVDDTFPAFRNRGLAVEAMGHFFLMHEYLNREKSFWKPYLDTLPGPDADVHRTPFFFDSPQDLAWLEDTDVLFTTKARHEIHESHYSQGIALIKAAHIDAKPYTRSLYQWAVTIFTSRSFSSQALRPHDSKYWTAYKTGKDGRRQTVLLDMSRASGEELDFPVLFPVMDIPNHDPNAKVSWSFDQGRFSMKVQDELPAKSELFNNYGPKRNDELLLGYGFCIPNNPHEKVLLTLKAPPEDLQQDIRRVQPGYFKNIGGEWSSEKATFAIDYIIYSQEKTEIFDQLPEPLLELMLYMLRHERNLPFTFTQHPTQYLTAEKGRQYLPHITRMIVQSLLPKMAKLQASTPPEPPSNAKQVQAQIYRTGQIRILESITGALRNYLRSLIYPAVPNPSGPLIVTLEGLLELLRLRSGPQACEDFLTGLGASAGTTIVEQLREAGWEDDAMVLLLCFVYSCCEMFMPEYMAQPADPAEDELEQARSAMELVEAARGVTEGSFWQDPRWSERFIAELGGRLLKFESFVMMVPTSQDTGDARLVVYVHG